MLQLAHPELLAMLNAVRAAGIVTRSVQADLVNAGTLVKDDKSPVTVADFASQAIIAHYLEVMSSNYPLVGEEDADELRQDENEHLRAAVTQCVVNQWSAATEVEVLDAIDRGRAECDGTGKYFTLDPIDGTKGFLRAEHYAIALGMIEDGIVTAAALGCPNLRGPAGERGVVFLAAKGCGTIAMSLMGMQLWSVADLAGPLIGLLALQSVAAVLFTAFVLFRVMGGDYMAAVLSAGFVGFSLGATPTAIANMTAVAKTHGPAPIAFIILPLVGAFFVDITNAFVLQFFLSL